MRSFMPQIEIFYLRSCPYCRHAGKAVKELQEDSRYSGLRIDWIEEREHPEIAGLRDYYYVPAVFLKGIKLYEADPSEGYTEIKAGIRSAFEQALQD